jgi:hypothetical protein
MAIDVNAIINRAVLIGTEKSDQASAAADTAMMAALGYSTLEAPAVATDVSVVEPSVYIPSNATGVDTALFNSTYDKIALDLGNKFASFFTDFFPLNPATMAAAEAWLYNAIVNGGSGINITVEDQIWQRDRDRITRAAQASEAEATASWAAKGFPMPVGAALGAVAQIRRDRDFKIYDAGRDRAIKSWEMEYANVKFAIQQAIDYRVKAVQAAGDYIRTLALAPQIASQLSTAALGAQAQLINAAASYYNARIKVVDMKLEKDKLNAGMTMSAGQTNMTGFNARIQNQTNAAVSIASSLGNQAASALNSVSAVAQVQTQQNA